ncbi:MAG TPA: efflux RND transporter periplasmic adaptor subunit [Burkholderiales bacterium]|nr:efflux RND transporter periplasmic adaptor subunit [Burkholderiales bacterium]
MHTNDPNPSVAAQDGARISTAYRRGTGRRIAVFATVAMVALAAGFLSVHFMRVTDRHHLQETSKAEASQRPLVNVITVQSPGAAHPLTLPGETAAWFESTLYARVNGYVAKWTVDIGEHVRKGQVLAVIETPELDADLVAARAELAAARALVTVRAAEAGFAKTTNERWKDSPRGVVSEQEREAKRSDYDSAQARLNAARAQVELGKARVERLAALQQFKQVVAPFDGTITERRIDVGNLVTAGSTSGNTLLYRVAQESPLRVFVDAPQSVSGELLKPGMAVQVKSAGLAGAPIDATVARTARAINPQARTLRVEVDIPNADLALVPGMYVDVTFALPGGNRVQVPAAALVFRSSGPQVAVVDGAGRVSFRKVDIARDDGSMVEIGSGLAAGDKVALNISSRIADGDMVSVAQSTDAGAPSVAKAR